MRDRRGRRDLVIVGMGSAGMVAAEFAAELGLRVTAVESGRVGGDCLWTGCVPSKALLASAKAAHTMGTAHVLGLPDAGGGIDTAPVWERLRSVQSAIAAGDDNPARFETMGVEIVRGRATMVGPNTVGVKGPAGAGSEIETRFVLICTGSRPAVPAIDGLAEAGYLTSESVFELEGAPDSVAFVGGGPIAIELAQAFRRLGISTTVLQKGPAILPRDEPDLVGVLSRILAGEGVEIHCGVTIDAVEVTGGRQVVHGRQGGTGATWSADKLVVAAGRRPNVEGLGLEGVGVGVGSRGVEVDGRMRTAVPSVYAVGDAAGRYLFTHSAGHEAVRAVRDMFFPGKGTVSDLIPWCTFTDPELAHVGLTSSQAAKRHGGRVRVWRAGLDHSDRARADAATDGSVLIVTARTPTGRDKVVGGHILAPAAGELIHELALAVHRGLGLDDLAFVHVYPTLSTSIGHLAAEAAVEKAKRLRWLVRKEKP